MASSSSESKGVLFIYEEDGRDWTNYLIKQLKEIDHSIPCTSVLWCFLCEELTTCCLVHILVLTPDMECHVSELKHYLLNYTSLTSILLECNVDSSNIDMVNWAVKHTLDDSPENQRNLLTKIKESHETAVKDADYADIVFDVAVIPTTIFPGHEEVHLIFNEDQSGELIFKMDGEELNTRKLSPHTFSCDLPKDACGRKSISVYQKETMHNMYTLTVTVVTVGALLHNLIENLENTFQSQSDNAKRMTTVLEMGIEFNPFLGASDDELTRFAHAVAQMPTRSVDVDRDSGYSQGPQKSSTNIAEKGRDLDSNVSEEDVQRRNLALRDSKERITTRFKNFFSTIGKRRANFYSEEELKKDAN